ncbi:hypothetical protein HanPI659440_Chr07g0254401 [Helianthus annuus]|nr:hypothetical protein HanPI659440_Chr07g0254401 [Helianthus annuus]
MGMVRIRNFEFVCRSQGEHLTVERFRAFYQLQNNFGFFSFALRNEKKILINPPKSFHDWKMKLFFIRGEVIPMVMQFRDIGSIPKEDLKIPRGAAWYEKLMALPNQAFGEQVLVAAEVALFHRVFLAHASVMGVRPLRAGKEYWLEQIRPNFMYARAELFAAPPVTTGGAYISNPRPCRAITPTGKEVVYLSSEESVASSEHELNPPHDVFAGVLRNLGIDQE